MAKPGDPPIIKNPDDTRSAATKRVKVEATIDMWLDLPADADCVAVTQAVQDELGFTGARVDNAEIVEYPK